MKRKFLALSTMLVATSVTTNCSVLTKDKESINIENTETKPIENKTGFTIKNANTNIQTATGMYYPVNMEHKDSDYIGFLDKNPKYGYKRHLGNDYHVSEGTSVVAITDGIVHFANMNVGNFGGDTPARNGGLIIIKHKMADGKEIFANYGHVKNLLVKEGDTVVAGQKIAEVGAYYSAGSYLPHLHFAINPTQVSTAGYESDSGNTFGFVSPETFMKSNEQQKHEFQGSGSLINTSGNCYGCNLDAVPLYANGNKSFTSFQWMYNASNCDHIDISSSNGMNYNVGVIAGSWSTRNNDKYYTAKLPVSIGHPRETYNIVGIMLPTNISQNDNLIAKCSNGNAIGSKTEVSRNIKGVPLTTGSIWNGQGSIISASTINEVGYGKTKDVALIKNTNDNSFGTVTFQWQPSSRCSALNIKDSFDLQQRASLSIREWNQGNNVTVLSDVQLPYKINNSTKSDLSSNKYYVITARSNNFASGKIFAECAN